MGSLRPPLVVALALMSCSGEVPTGLDGGAASPLEAQLALGSGMFAARCANCHGPRGQGGVGGPPLVGLERGALPLEPRPEGLREVRFETAADVLAFVSESMPADAPGALSPGSYLALTAFLLSENGLVLQDALHPESAASLRLR